MFAFRNRIAVRVHRKIQTEGGNFTIRNSGFRFRGAFLSFDATPVVSLSIVGSRVVPKNKSDYALRKGEV